VIGHQRVRCSCSPRPRLELPLLLFGSVSCDTDFNDAPRTSKVQRGSVLLFSPPSSPFAHHMVCTLSLRTVSFIGFFFSFVEHWRSLVARLQTSLWCFITLHLSIVLSLCCVYAHTRTSALVCGCFWFGAHLLLRSASSNGSHQKVSFFFLCRIVFILQVGISSRSLTCVSLLSTLLSL
jgi:hypothetical protein